MIKPTLNKKDLEPDLATPTLITLDTAISGGVLVLAEQKDRGRYAICCVEQGQLWVQSSALKALGIKLAVSGETKHS